MARRQADRDILEAALIGLQLQREQIEAKMAELRRQAVGRNRTRPSEPAPLRKGRTMSAAARNRIAAAQRKRWAEYHKKHRKTA